LLQFDGGLLWKKSSRSRRISPTRSRGRSQPTQQKALVPLKFFIIFSSWWIVSSFYTFLVDCQYELLIDLCCLMPLWKAVFCIFFILFILYISPRMLSDAA